MESTSIPTRLRLALLAAARGVVCVLVNPQDGVIRNVLIAKVHAMASGKRRADT